MWWPRRAALVGWCLGPALWGLANCTSVVPQALRGEVDRGLTYAQLAQDPEGYRGRTVVLGGEVLRVRPAGRDLELTLAERPLSPVDESPMLGRASGGDLVVQVPGAARAEFREGFVVTVVGVVLGRESAEDPASPPRLEARHIQVWPVGQAQLPPGARW
jgi:outer membrane lipoprotein